MNQFQTIEDWPCGQVTKYVKTRSSQVEIRRRSFRRGNSHGTSRHKSCNLGHWPLGPPTGRTLIYCCWRLVSIGGRGQDRTLLIEVGVAQGPGGRVRLLSRVPSCVCYQEVDAVKPGESLCARIWRPICLRTLPPPPPSNWKRKRKKTPELFKWIFPSATRLFSSERPFSAAPGSDEPKSIRISTVDTDAPFLSLSFRFTRKKASRPNVWNVSVAALHFSASTHLH